MTIEQLQAVYDRSHGPGVVLVVPDPTPAEPNRVRIDKGRAWELWNARQKRDARKSQCPR